ncbi:MAG TPA: Tol-Pal system beta propeller repeat protein TolB [Thermodesulfovibrionales bacterium]|nr:Tol-Pal system beta propeller repeat protein TolB [Thermodesulfovibrionales bacterium]
MIKKRKFRIVLVGVLSALVMQLSLLAADAKVYVDISSPAFRRLPIAIQEFTGPYGKDISDIIRNDLDFTGLFVGIDKEAFVESPSSPFNAKNWSSLGAEAVLKGASSEGKTISVSASLYDVYPGTAILQKGYTTSKEYVRLLAHTIANDVYYLLTGEKGVFKTKIAFIAEGKGERAIYQMDWDGGRMSKLSSGGNMILSIRWARDGSKLAFSAERHRQWAVYLLDFKSRSEKKIFAAKGTNIVGDFSPDGNNVILSSSKDGKPELYSMDIASGNATRLSSSHGIEVSPSVSPDGKQVAFVSDRGGSPQIYTMKADGSGVKRITFDGSYNTSPSWSPKGDRIVYSGRRGTNQVFIINPDGSGLIQLTSQGNNEDPSFSPDGRYITFTSDRDGVKGVYIMRTNGEAQKRISPKGIKAFCPRWAPDL